MPKVISSALRDRIMRTAAPESPLILLEVTHSQLAQPLRLVNDTSDLVHNGNNYVGIPFRAVWPDDQEEQSPRATLAVDNVGREMMVWIEASNGAVGASVVMKQVLRSNPDYVEMQVELGLQSIEVTLAEVRFNLSFPDIFFKPLVRLTYRPETHPGIF